MGIRSGCICPDVLVQYINNWFFIYTENDTQPFYDTQWQLVDVGVNYIVVRRFVADIGGVQTAVLFCNQIVGLAAAPPGPMPPVNG